MQKEYHILMHGEKNCGALTLDQHEKGIIAKVYIEEKPEFICDGVLKFYIVCLETGNIEYVGVLQGFQGDFVIKSMKSPAGFVITLKNSEQEQFFACAAQEGKIVLTREIYEKNFCVKKEQIPEKTNSPETAVKLWYKKEYRKSCVKKLEELLVGYNSEKINGYFVKERCKILEYILSFPEVYDRITKYGYYMFFHTEYGKEKTFVVAVPFSNEEKNPFKNCTEYVFEIVPEIEGDVGYFCVGAGEDERGDFFCKKL